MVTVLYVIVGIAFGARGVLFFGLQSIVAIMLLESINYVQHYGLSRRVTRAGRFEPVAEAHSWNSNHPVSNWFLLNLGRHSDHHCDPAKRYPSLDERPMAPQLPTGLCGMFVLALFPPLWRRVMDPLVQAYSVPEPLN